MGMVGEREEEECRYWEVSASVMNRASGRATRAMECGRTRGSRGCGEVRGASRGGVVAWAAAEEAAGRASSAAEVALGSGGEVEWSKGGGEDAGGDARGG